MGIGDVFKNTFNNYVCVLAIKPIELLKLSSDKQIKTFKISSDEWEKRYYDYKQVEQKDMIINLFGEIPF